MKKLLTILLILIAAQGFAQEQGVYQKLPIYGAQYKRLKGDSAILIPTFCGVPTLLSTVGNQSAIAYDSCGHKFYVYDPTDSTWIVGNLSGTDSSSYHTIGQASDSSYFTISKPDGTVDTVRFVMDSTGGSSSYTLPVASGSTLGGIKVGSGLSIDGSGVLSTSLPYTSYVAALTQSGTSAPVAVVSQNNTGFTFTYSYVSVGRYLLTCSGTAFATGHSFVMTQNQAFTTPVLFESTTGGTTQLNLFTRKTDGTNVDGSLNGEIEIRIYP